MVFFSDTQENITPEYIRTPRGEEQEQEQESQGDGDQRVPDDNSAAPSVSGSPLGSLPCEAVTRHNLPL